MPPLAAKENRPMMKVLLQDGSVAAGQEMRLLPELNVGDHAWLHIHIGRSGKAVSNLAVRVLFGPLVPAGAGESAGPRDTDNEREFLFRTPANYNQTGLIVSVPVIAPLLSEIVLTNNGSQTVDELYIALLAQEL
jgi:hypothetical protein